MISLLPRRPEMRRKRLPPEIKQAIDKTLREQWLVLEVSLLAPVVPSIRARCVKVGFRPPSYTMPEYEAKLRIHCRTPVGFMLVISVHTY